jgi:cathepsin F
MKSVVLFCILGLAAASLTEFRSWAATHGKTYTPLEESRRAAIYQNNKLRVAALNAENSGATFALNQFADLTAEEFKAMYMGRPRTPRGPVPVAKAVSVGALPPAFNWKDNGAVVAVKNQGSCGSCWSFSAVANMEGVWFKAGHPLVSLSEQQLVDCDHVCQDPNNKDTCDQGCNGGYMENAFAYAVAHGMESEATYKYSGSDGTCKFSNTSIVAKFSNWEMVVPIDSRDEATVQNYLYTHSPLAIAVHADPWQFYFGGIFTSSCPGGEANLDHGVSLVGWGTDTSKGLYWIVKNSWGAIWGESGYIRVQFGKDLCGIADDVSSIIA